jgi:putative phage-type endonuclease
MLINQDFTRERTKYLGGSDIGAILGFSKYRTTLDVWLEKTGREVNTADNLPVRFGTFAEEFVANEYANQTGYSLAHSEEGITHPKYPFMVGHIDRFVFDTNDALTNELINIDGSCAASHLLECKTASPFNQSDWGELGTDEVPMCYLVQCLWYLAITNLERCDVAVLFGNSDFRIYEVYRDKELEDLIISKAAAFWNDYVQLDTPPPAQCESDYQGQVLATWKSPKQSYRLDSKKLEIEHPELIPQYQVPIQNSRRLVIKEVMAKANPELNMGERA